MSSTRNDAKKEMDAIKRALVAQGWRIRPGKGAHSLAFSPDPSVPPVGLTGSPSDHHAMKNLRGLLRRRGAIL